MARDAHLTGIRAQLLCFPATCHPKFAPASTYELGSYRQNRDASVVTSARLEWFLDEYMPEPSDDWKLSCLLAPELGGLPPACECLHVLVKCVGVLVKRARVCVCVC